jgi:hypothetical protein
MEKFIRTGVEAGSIKGMNHNGRTGNPVEFSHPSDMIYMTMCDKYIPDD